MPRLHSRRPPLSCVLFESLVKIGIPNHKSYSHVSLIRHFIHRVMDWTNFPEDCEEKLKPFSHFPQTIVYKTHITGHQSLRSYDGCGCFTQYETGPPGTTVQCHCTFHDGCNQCFWNDDQQYALLTGLCKRHQDRRDELQKLIEDASIALNTVSLKLEAIQAKRARQTR